MKALFAWLEKQKIDSLGTPLSGQALEALRKRLETAGLPCLPPAVALLLRRYNGLKNNETLVFGDFADKPEYDMISRTLENAAAKDVLILGCDDLSVLIWYGSKKTYLLLDKETAEVVEDFTEDETELAYGSIVH
jgi:hypothetical protein